MAVVKVDRELCQGYANCVAVAGDVFDVDDEGIVVLLTDSVPESERARVAKAALSCPVSALAVADE